MTATIVAIIGVALATFVTRASGLYLMRGVTVRGRMKAALDALPPAILVSLIAPTILTTGIAETIAAVITAGAAFMRLPLVVVVGIGVVCVVLLRTVIS